MIWAAFPAFTVFPSFEIRKARLRTGMAIRKSVKFSINTITIIMVIHHFSKYITLDSLILQRVKFTEIFWKYNKARLLLLCLLDNLTRKYIHRWMINRLIQHRYLNYRMILKWEVWWIYKISKDIPVRNKKCTEIKKSILRAKMELFLEMIEILLMVPNSIYSGKDKARARKQSLGK